MTKLLRFWWRFDAAVDRGAYLRHGAALMALKFAGDAAIVWLFTGRSWWIGDYMRPLATFVNDGSAAYYGLPAALLPTLALWALPFLWIGITLTGRRLSDAGWPTPLVLLFFVPFVNYALMLVLCILPTDQPSYMDGDAIERSLLTRGAAAAIAVGTGATVSALLLALSVYWVRQYGFGLFVGVPFFACALTAWMFTRLHPEAEEIEAVVCSFTMLATVTLGLLALRVEGVVCLLMASPLALGIGYFGGKLGYRIAADSRSRSRLSILGLLALPATLVAPLGAPPPSLPTHVVLSSVEISAPADVVWPRVIAFSPIEPPTEWLFRLGVAYPVRARIDGAGVGAVRYCEFSTGAFVEPITAWEPNRRLAFDVSAQPVPMRELTPFSGVTPPHLKGFLTTQHGEFRLVDLGNGRTRLEGRTWYTIDMGPEAYWQLYTDHIIHGIHLRVLDHIKQEAESAAR